MTALGTSSDANDLFNMKMPRLNKRSNTVAYKSKAMSNRRNSEIMLKTIFEENNMEDDNENEIKEKKTQPSQLL